MTIREELTAMGFSYSKLEGDFGVEVETETKNFGSYPEGVLVECGDGYKCPSLEMWRIHKDGSLRNFGLEYVFKEPYSYKDSFAALDEFGKVMAKTKFIKNAPATSIHTHINALNMTWVELGNYLTTWTLYENAIVEFCGEVRRSNLFALPTRCAETTYSNIVRLFSKVQAGDTSGINFSENATKYAAMNLAKLNSFGSIEARCMRGTTDISEIKQWLSILEAIRVYSRTPHMTPVDVLNEYRSLDGAHLREVFGGSAKLLNDACEGRIEDYVERNLWYTKCIAEAADWTKINTAFREKVKENPKPKRKTSGMSVIAKASHYNTHKEWVTAAVNTHNMGANMQLYYNPTGLLPGFLDHLYEGDISFLPVHPDSHPIPTFQPTPASAPDTSTIGSVPPSWSLITDEWQATYNQLNHPTQTGEF